MIKPGDIIYVLNSLGMPLRITKRKIMSVYDGHWLLVSDISSCRMEIIWLCDQDINWFTTLHAAKQYLLEHYASKRQKNYKFVERNGGLEITWDELEKYKEVK